MTDAARRDLIESIRPDLDDLEHVVPCDGEAGGFWDLLDAASDAFTPADTSADDPALLIYTSGTTGPPKGALNAHRCLLGNLPGFELSHDFFPHEGDLMWSPADWAWTGGLLDALVPALRYGVPVLGYDGGKFDPERAFSLIGKYRVRNAFIPPTALKLMMQVPDGVARGTSVSMRSIMSAGEQVGAEVFHWADEALGVKGQRDVGPDGDQLSRGQLRRGDGRASGLHGQALPGAHRRDHRRRRRTRWPTAPWASSPPGAATR